MRQASKVICEGLPQSLPILLSFVMTPGSTKSNIVVRIMKYKLKFCTCCCILERAIREHKYLYLIMNMEPTAAGLSSTESAIIS